VRTTTPLLAAHKPPEFLFRGNAVAAGGFITRIGDSPQRLDPKVITTHAESCLPMIGGISHTIIESPNIAYRTNIAYGRVETFVEGRYEGDQTVTTLRASVNGIRLTNSPSAADNVPAVRSITFTAASLSIEVESIHPQKGQPTFKVNPGRPDGMALVVTDAAGTATTLPVELVFDDHLLSLANLDAMDREFLSNREFFQEQAPQLPTKSKLVYGKSKIPRTAQGYVFGSFVRQIRVGDEIIAGNTLTRKGFGTIQFGVMLTDPFCRRVSLARIKMGSDAGADVSFSGVETNGIWK
jgi:hypothetical protein